MRLFLLVVVLFALPALAHGDDFHCQSSSFGALLAAYTGGNAELADDIPATHAGRSIDQITLWMMIVGPWKEPDGVRIRFYNSTCPPTLTHDSEYTFAWSTVNPVWVPELLWGGYRITLTLASPVTVGADMSIGASIISSWGTSPWAGFYTTPVITGCEGYWESSISTRWSPISSSTTAADLAYCLTEITTSVSASPSDQPSSWSEVKSHFR